MPVPVALATVAACGSIVTSIKSSWELRRMLKKKKEARECDEEAPYVFRRLRRTYYDGLMSTQEYEHWYEKFLVAKVEKDLSGMRRIRAHLRILENGAPVTPDQRSRAYEEASRRRHSVSYAERPPHVEWRHDGRIVGYQPDRYARVGAPRDQFVRLEEKATYSRSPARSDAARSHVSRSSSVRHEARGRPERRYYDSYDSSDSSEYFYSEKRQRGRSLNR